MNVMEDLKAYVDGELSPERRAEIDLAIEQDEALRQEMEEIRVLSRLIGDCIVELEPVGMAATLKVLEARKSRSVFGRLFREPRRFAWVWAMSVFILLAVFLPLIRGTRGEMDEAASGAVATDLKSSAPQFSLQKRSTNGSRAAAPLGGSLGDPTVQLKAPADVPRSGGFAGGAGFGSGKVPMPTRGGVSPNGNSTKQDFSSNSDKGGDVAAHGAYAQGSTPLPAHEGNINGFNSGEIAKKTTRPSPAPAAATPPLLIRTGDLALTVASVQKSEAEVTTLTKSFVGYVESSSSNTDANDVPQAQITVRVPEPKFEQAMTRFRSLGKVESQSVTGQDVTAQVTDIEARLKVLRTSETSYIAMLAKARKVDDALSIRDRLDDVRQQIESMDSQRKTLRNQATYSTISLNLSEKREAPKPAPQPGWFDTAWSGATERASGLGKWLAEVGMNLLLLAPAWVPIVGLAWWLGRRRVR